LGLAIPFPRIDPYAGLRPACKQCSVTASVRLPFNFVPSMKRLLLSSLLIDHTSCFFSHCRTTVPNAANHAADAASSVTLLCVLCVAIGSPAHDKKRGVRHHLRDDRRAAKERTVLITPSGGCASGRGPYAAATMGTA
jgi:hypothetical protein